MITINFQSCFDCYGFGNAQRNEPFRNKIKWHSNHYNILDKTTLIITSIKSLITKKKLHCDVNSQSHGSGAWYNYYLNLIVHNCITN